MNSPARASGCFTWRRFLCSCLADTPVCEVGGGILAIGTPVSGCAFVKREPITLP